jgi:hypothetical protein
MRPAQTGMGQTSWRRLSARGVSVLRLAVEAGEHPSNLYVTLAGCPVGPVRRARIAEAARRLLSEAAETEDDA